MLRTLLAATLLSLLVVSVATEGAAPVVLLSNTETRSAFCPLCLKIVGAIEEGVENHEQDLVKHLEKICDDVLGHIGNLAQQCKDWIDQDFAKIMEKLENDWTADAICKDMHLC